LKKIQKGLTDFIGFHFEMLWQIIVVGRV